MPFPFVNHVRYARSQLESVTYQVSYPVILRIDADVPVAFQEEVREHFPGYEKREPGARVLLYPNFPSVQIEETGTNNRSHIFKTLDNSSFIRLTRSLMSLTCRGVGCSDAAKSRFSAILSALVKTYHPAPFTHCCVRHRYFVHRSKLGLDTNASWRALLQPWVFGPYTDPAIADDLTQAFSKYMFRLPDTMGELETSIGLAEEKPSKERVLLIDTHAFTNSRTVPDNVLRIFDDLSEQQRLFFRHAINAELHRALQPDAGGVAG